MPAATLLAPAGVAAAEQDLANIIAGFLAATSDDVAVSGAATAAGTNTYLARFSGTLCAAHACAPCKLRDSFAAAACLQHACRQACMCAAFRWQGPATRAGRRHGCRQGMHDLRGRACRRRVRTSGTAHASSSTRGHHQVPSGGTHDRLLRGCARSATYRWLGAPPHASPALASRARARGTDSYLASQEGGISAVLLLVQAIPFDLLTPGIGVLVGDFMTTYTSGGGGSGSGSGSGGPRGPIVVAGSGIDTGAVCRALPPAMRWLRPVNARARACRRGNAMWCALRWRVARLHVPPRGTRCCHILPLLNLSFLALVADRHVHASACPGPYAR